MEALEREASVQNGLEDQQRPLRPTDVWNVKTQENLESFRRQGMLG